MLCLCALTIVSAALIFMQLGFIGIGKPGEYMAYAIGLLAPVAAGSLLLGTLLGTLHGLLSGGILYVHARLLPLDVFERYFTNPLSSIVLLGCAGLVMGVCLALASGIKSRVVRWTVTLAACLAVSALATYAFSLIVDVQLQGYWETFTEVVETEEGTHEETQTLSMRTLALYNSTFADRRIQAFTQFVLMSVVCVAVYAFVRFLYDTAQMRTMRTEFRLRTLSAMILTFLVVSSVGFVSITFGLSAGARKSMNDELNFLKLQLLEYVRYADVLSTVELNDEQRLELDFNMETSTLVDGYDADNDYTILVFSQDDKRLAFTNNPAYELYMREDVVLGSKAMTNVSRLVETGEVAQIPWAGDFFSMEEERVSAQLAFVGAIDVDEYTVVLVAPFTRVFAQRETARSIQESALPRMYPAFPGNDRVDLFALMDPAREVGGDFYDFFELDDHTVAFLIADVSGKGIPASLW